MAVTQQEFDERLRDPTVTRSDLKEREFICPECSRRCTRGTDGLEYGHERGPMADDGTSRGPRCSRRPLEVEPDKPNARKRALRSGGDA